MVMSIKQSGMVERSNQGMDKSFDVDKFIADIGTDLVKDFERARGATSPTAVGDAMEFPVRD